LISINQRLNDCLALSIYRLIFTHIEIKRVLLISGSSCAQAAPITSAILSISADGYCPYEIAVGNTVVLKTLNQDNLL
jgi:hypothetical protein